jgi:hypothetical protein
MQEITEIAGSKYAWGTTLNNLASARLPGPVKLFGPINPETAGKAEVTGRLIRG